MRFSLTSFIFLFSQLIFVNCHSESTESQPSGYHHDYATVSLYDPDAFDTGCETPPDGVPDHHQFAPSEGMLGIQCKDQWVKVKDPYNPPDVEEKDMQDLGVYSKKEYLERAYSLCNGTCVKKIDGVFYINIPGCGVKNYCKNKKKYKVEINGITKQGYIHSACPSRHWKNYFKGVAGIGGGNHCAKPHIDLSLDFSNSFGVNYSNQGVSRARVYESY